MSKFPTSAFKTAYNVEEFKRQVHLTGGSYEKRRHPFICPSEE